MNKKQYIAPTLTVVTFKSERGYAQSNPSKMALFCLSVTPYKYNSQAMENWNDRGDAFTWGTE